MSDVKTSKGMVRADYILPHIRGQKILHIGCTDHVIKKDSPAWLHGRILAHFPEVHGLDINRTNLDMMRGMGIQNLHEGNAEDFDLGDLRFDTIVAGELIEHLTHPAKMLAAAKKHLAPGGRLIITTPHPFALFNMLWATFKNPKTCNNPEHTLWFCPQTFQEMLRRLGLRTQYFSYIPDYNPDNQKWLYKLFVFLMRYGLIFPKIWRYNAMIFVVEQE